MLLVSWNAKRETTYVGLASVPTNLGNQEVDTKRSILVLQVGLDFVDRSLEELGALAETTDDANTTYHQ